MNLKIISIIFNLLCSKEYDYIVIGGGSSGGVVAYELSKKGHSTLLIEAGPAHKDGNITTPIFHGNAAEDPKISFEYFVDLYTNSSIKQNTFYPRATGLGGCSLHNAEISIYPNAIDFENMVKHTGNQLFSEPEMRKVFKEMEINHYPLFSKAEDHGKSEGWFSISYVNILKQLSLDLKVVNVLLTIVGNIFHDLNGKINGVLGADVETRAFVPQNVDKNYERGDFQGMILSASEKYGLDIWTNTFVTKILLDENNNAHGVEYKRGEYLYKASPLNQPHDSIPTEHVYAKREIIVSTGTFNTPQLLMLSGIGPKEQLEKLDIPVKVDLQGVGKNLQDRYEITLVNKLYSNWQILNGCKLVADPKKDPCYKQYLETKTGPYISNGALSAMIRKSDKKLKTPDLITLYLPTRFTGYYKGFSADYINYFDEMSNTVIKARTANKGGYVELKSSDPFDTPKINFNNFSDDLSDNNKDLKILVDHLKYLRKKVKADLFFTPYKEIFPGPNVKSDKDLIKYIKETLWGHHACCTAKMGSGNDAVIDSNFRVHGVKNLRIMDMSIFPEIPAFYPVLYLQMVATQMARIVADNV